MSIKVMAVLSDFSWMGNWSARRGGRRPAWRHGLAFAAGCLFAVAAQALGLDAIRLQSGLGQPLRAQIALLGADAEDIRATCVKARLESSDGAFIGMLQVAIRDGSPTAIQLSSRQNIDEPAVNVLLDVHCAGSLRRSYPLLLDPPALLAGTVAAPQQAAVPVAVRLLPVTTAVQADTGRDASSATTSLRVKRAAAGLHAEQALPAPEASLRNAGRMPRPKGKKPARSVLRLAAGDTPVVENKVNFQLKLSDTLSDTPIASDPESRDALRAARARLAAALNGEDPERHADRQIRTLQDQLQALQAETARLARERRADKDALEEIRRQSFSFGWVATLGGLLLLSLGASAWLLRRAYGGAGLPRAPWWENTASATRAEATDTPHASTVALPAMEESEQAEDDAEQSDAPAVPTDAPLVSVCSEVQLAAAVDGATGDLSAYSRRSNGLKAEEVTDGLEEAEFWMLLNVPERAIEILEQYNKGDRPSSPQPWLCLLDLYREVGDEKKYTELLHRFASLFNVSVPEWNEVAETEKQLSLEDFPHLMERICVLWQTDGIVPFLERLLYDSRDGARTGFGMPAYRELMLLADIAHELAQDGQSARTAPVSSD